MATPHERSTYVFDLVTINALNVLVKRWGVSKSAALRKAVQQAYATLHLNESSNPTQALKSLEQGKFAVNKQSLKKHLKDLREERIARANKKHKAN